MAQTVLQRADPRTTALGDTIDDLLTTAAARARLAARIHGLDIAYDLGGGHPLLGRRMPDLDLDTGSGPTRVYALLHEARPVLLDFAGCAAHRHLAVGRPGSRTVDVAFTGTWELPVLGKSQPPTAVLVRPDGHVAWVENGTDEPLTDALTRWFGPATATPPDWG